MELLILLGLIAAVWFWAKHRKAKSAVPLHPVVSEDVDAPALRVTITSSSYRSTDSPADVGELASAGDQAEVAPEDRSS